MGTALFSEFCCVRAHTFCDLVFLSVYNCYFAILVYDDIIIARVDDEEELKYRRRVVVAATVL